MIVDAEDEIGELRLTSDPYSLCSVCTCYLRQQSQNYSSHSKDLLAWNVAILGYLLASFLLLVT